MSQPLISVIVPAYNAEKWIGDCCRSVFEQTYSNWELIVVDDGSTDDTGRILSELAQKETKLHSITTENGGVCRARNIGLDAAKGTYITFLDADDRLTVDALEKMWKLMCETDCQIAAMTKIVAGTNPPAVGPTEIWAGHRALEMALEDHVASHSVYAKLYLRDLIGDIRFVEGRKINEDSFFVFQCFAKANQVAYRKDTVYLYTVTPGSASRSAFSKKYFDILYFAEEKARILTAEFPQYTDRIGAIQMRANIALLYNLCKTYAAEYRPAQRQCLAYIRNNRKTFQPVTALEKRVLCLAQFRLFWLYKCYLHVRLRKNQ